MRTILRAKEAELHAAVAAAIARERAAASRRAAAQAEFVRAEAKREVTARSALESQHELDREREAHQRALADLRHEVASVLQEARDEVLAAEHRCQALGTELARTQGHVAALERRLRHSHPVPPPPRAAKPRPPPLPEPDLDGDIVVLDSILLTHPLPR